jgi:hypothetical protein
MEVEICLGLNDIDADLKLSIYPNPTDNISNIQWISDIKSTYQFSLYQIDGKKIYETEVKGTGGIKIQSIEMNSLANGIYLLEIKKDNILVSQRKITKN